MNYLRVSATGMLRVCEASGCRTIVFGRGTCTDHDRRGSLSLGRGRPFVEQDRGQASPIALRLGLELGNTDDHERRWSARIEPSTSASKLGAVPSSEA
jgi:hypothetical protein